MIRDYAREKLHKYYRAAGVQDKSTMESWSASTFLCHTRGRLASALPFRAVSQQGVFRGLILWIFSHLIVTLHVLLAESKRNCKAHIVYQYVTHYLLSCYAQTLVSFWYFRHVKVHISIALIPYQPLHLPPSYTSLPETVFTRCLSSWQSKYQRGAEGGLAMQILTCCGAQLMC